MWHYFAYGLTIESDLEIPEFDCINPAQDEVDVWIRREPILGRAGMAEDAASRWDVTPECARFYWNGVGAYEARDGEIIAVDNVSSVEASLARLPLLGIVFSALLAQRGHAVLHGSAVSIEGRAVAFLADKGFGKSTMAAAMCHAGHELLADDVTVVARDTSNEVFTVIPAFSQLKLWPEIVTHLGIDSATVPALHSLVEKRSMQPDVFSRIPVPISRLYLLRWGDELNVQQLSATETFFSIARHSYEARCLSRHPDTPSRLLQSYGPVAREVVTCVLTRRSSLDDLDATIELIQRDLEEDNSTPTHADSMSAARA